VRGYFYYFRLENCGDLQLRIAVRLLQSIGRVRASGLGTAKDRHSAWVELRARDSLSSIAEIRAALKTLDLPCSVPDIVEIDLGEGSTQAKQLDLFC
jgi:hypothetical protein